MSEELVRLSKADARLVLRTGFLEQSTGKKVGLPEAVLDGEILFRTLSPETIPGRGSFAAWMTGLRVFSLTATTAPFMMIMIYGLYKGWSLNPLNAFTAVLAIICLQLAINLLNDYEDHIKLIDLPGTFGGSGVLQSGKLSPQDVRFAAFLCIGLASLLAIPSLLNHPKMTLGIGMLGLLGVLGYSSRPLDLKYKALGDLTVFILCGPALALGYSTVMFGNSDVGVCLVGVSAGAAAAVILHANNIADIVVDTRSGAKTLASCIGFRNSQFYMVLLIAISLVAVPWGSFQGYFPFVALVGFAPSLYFVYQIVRKTFRASGPESFHISLLRFDAAKFHLFLGIGFCLSMTIAFWYR